MMSPIDLAMERNHNPLRRDVKVDRNDRDFNSKFLAHFKEKIDLKDAVNEP